MRFIDQLYSTILLLLVCHSTLLAHQQASSSCSDYSSTEDNLLQEFCLPLLFRRNDVSTFLRTCFNNPLYAQDYFPHCFDHLFQFLNYAQTTKQPALFYESIFRLFLNKLKECPYVSCYALQSCSAHLPIVLKNMTIHTNHTLQSKLYSTYSAQLCDMMVHDFELFKHDMASFINNVSLKLVKITYEPWLQESFISTEQLRHIIVRFLEIALLKVVWPVQDGIATWHNFNAISLDLSHLMNQGIISKDELDDLYHSLTQSYCRFIHMHGSNMSKSVLEYIKNSLAQGSSLITLLEEQEQDLATKKAHISTTIMHALARNMAQEHGIVLKQN